MIRCAVQKTLLALGVSFSVAPILGLAANRTPVSKEYANYTLRAVVADPHLAMNGLLRAMQANKGYFINLTNDSIELAVPLDRAEAFRAQASKLLGDQAFALRKVDLSREVEKNRSVIKSGRKSVDEWIKLLATAKDQVAIQKIQRELDRTLSGIEENFGELSSNLRLVNKAFFAIQLASKSSTLKGLGADSFIDFPWMQNLQLESLLEDRSQPTNRGVASEPLPQSPEPPDDEPPYEDYGDE